MASRKFRVSAVGSAAVVMSLASVMPVAADNPTSGRALGLAPNDLGPRATQLADMNGDGRADVFSYRQSDNAFLVSYSGTSSWTVLAYGSIDPSNTWLADMNGDGKADVFSYRPSDHAWLVSYSGTSNWNVINHAYLDRTVTRFGDTTGDGKADVFTRLGSGEWVRSAGGVGAWEVINGGGFQASTTWIGDLNGDGVDDVVAVDANSAWAVSYGGTGAWQQLNHGALDPARTQLVDINGDGKADIFTVTESDQWVASYGGTSSWQVVNNGDLDPTRTWLADMNGDGRVDLFSVMELSRWMVSYSSQGAWSQINNGYLPKDAPPPAATHITTANNPPASFAGNATSGDVAGAYDSAYRVSDAEARVAPGQGLGERVYNRGEFNHNATMFSFAKKRYSPGSGRPLGTFIVSAGTYSKVPFVEYKAEFVDNEVYAAYLGTGDTPTEIELTESWSVSGFDVSVSGGYPTSAGFTISSSSKEINRYKNAEDVWKTTSLTDFVRFDAFAIYRVRHGAVGRFHFGPTFDTSTTTSKSRIV